MTWSVIAAIASIAAVVASIATVGLKLATCAYVMRWGRARAWLSLRSATQTGDSQEEFLKFSRSSSVASRNSLYQILAIHVALGTGQRAKSCSPRPIGTGVRDKAGEIATANFREFLYYALG
jgi:hypothetical protein